MTENLLSGGMGVTGGLIKPDSAWREERDEAEDGARTGAVLGYRAHLRGCSLQVTRMVPLAEYPGKDWSWEVWLDAKRVGGGREESAGLARAAALNAAWRGLA